MAKRVVLVEGPSTDGATLARVIAEIPASASVMVVLDSDHSRDHVLAELRSYGPLVTEGCYLVIADTLLGHLDPGQTPRNRSQVWLKGNEPLSALEAYLEETDRFEIDPVLNGKLILSSSPGAICAAEVVDNPIGLGPEGADAVTRPVGAQPPKTIAFNRATTSSTCSCVSESALARLTP